MSARRIRPRSIAVRRPRAAAWGALVLAAAVVGPLVVAQPAFAAGDPVDMAVFKGASTDPVVPGSTFDYYLSVYNDGSTTATQVTVTDPLPAGATYVSATTDVGSCGQSSGTVTCLLGTMAGGAGANITITVTAPNAVATITNTAHVSSAEADTYPDDNVSTVDSHVGYIDLSITKTETPSPAVTGGPMTYTLAVTNNGPSPATGVVVTDALPPGVKFKQANSTAGTCSQSAGTVTCALGGLDVGATTTVTVNVAAPSTAGIVTNTATVSSDQPDVFTDNNSSSNDTPVSGPGCGQVVKKSKTLTRDIGPCLDAGLVIGADDITVDLGGHHLVGTGPTASRTHAGILLQGHQGVTITNGDISGFNTGVLVKSANNNTITNLHVHDNIGPDSPRPALGDGIAVYHASFNQITANTVTHNGPHDGIGVAGLDSTGNLITGNAVTHSVGSTLDGTGGEGIVVSAVNEPNDPRRGQPITANDVTYNTVLDNAATGILSVSNTAAHFEHNDVEGNGVGGTAPDRNGIEITFDVVGGASGATKDTVHANKSFDNGDDGVLVRSGANVIAGNHTTGNNANASGSFDLFDTHPDCDGNRWKNNTWGTAGFSPTCVSNGGTGPAPASA